MTPEEAEEYTASLGQIGGGLWRQILWAHRQGIPAALGLTLREWVDGRLGGYVRLAVDERRRLVQALTAPEDDGGAGMTQTEAAGALGVTQGRISQMLNPKKPDQADSDISPANSAGSNPAGSKGTASPENISPANSADDIDLPDDRADVIAELVGQTPPPQPVSEPVPLPAGTFACIVIDPPWPVSKIRRGTRPWQMTALDYPVMSLSQIEALPVPDLAADGGCHLYLWVTHRYLPDGLRLAAGWGFRYQCLMTWRKDTGMIPYSWMYDTEHVIFATRGKLPVARRGLRLSFDEPAAGHSVKPEVFYDRVIAASPAPRLEMFARRARSGFTSWGNEVTDAVS